MCGSTTTTGRRRSTGTFVGTDPATDAVVYDEPDPGFFISVGKTQSRRYIVIDSHDHETSEVRIVDARGPIRAPRLVAPRKTGEEYDVDHGGDRFFILTNADGAEDFKIVTAPEDRPGRRNWRRSFRIAPGASSCDSTVYKGISSAWSARTACRASSSGSSRRGEEHAIAFDEEAYSLGVIDGYEFDTTTLRFTYSSMTTPTRVYDYDMASATRVLRKEEEIPSGHDPDDYVTRRVFAPAQDGETVPVSLLYRKGTPLDGSAPLPALRLRRLRHGHAGGVRDHAPVAGRPRLRLRHRPRPRRQGEGLPLVCRRAPRDKVNTFSDFIAAARIS